jgi:hypothetical protein
METRRLGRGQRRKDLPVIRTNVRELEFDDSSGDPDDDIELESPWNGTKM